MKHADPRLTSEATRTRRAVVLKNMCELMKSMGQDAKFDNPDDWLDSIVERPRPSASRKFMIRPVRRQRSR